jgi:predicted metal-dependent peptidase
MTEALVRRCWTLAMTLGWRSPFFFPVLAHVEFIASDATSTACVDVRGRIRIAPRFAAQLSDQELQFVIAHELMHLLMLHHDRRGDRDPARWNTAADLLINYTLVAVASSGTCTFAMPRHGIIANEKQAKKTTEQLYDELEASSSGSGGGSRGNSNEVQVQTEIPVGAGCGVVDAGSELETPSEAQLKRQWRECAAQSQLLARQSGSRTGNLLADFLDVPAAKVRWSALVRGVLSRATSEAGRDDVTWTRRSRRSTPEIILPGPITHRCRAAVVIDTSASMSDDQLAQAVAETATIVEHCRVPVFLVVHDVDVHAACWIRPGSKNAVATRIQRQLKGRGGTLFQPAYKRVAAEGKFNVMIHLTDGWIDSPWPDRPATVRRLVVALLNTAISTAPMPPPKDARVVEITL